MSVLCACFGAKQVLLTFVILLGFDMMGECVGVRGLVEQREVRSEGSWESVNESLRALSGPRRMGRSFVRRSHV